MESLSNVLAGIIRLVVTVGFLYIVYLFIQIQIRRGFFRFPNPFQPGWRQLHNQYGSLENVHTTELIFGWVGAWKYELKIKFNAQNVLIRNMTSSAVAVQIPYTDIQVMQTPTSWQLTRFSAKEYTAGKFQVGSISIELPAYWADQLLKHIAATSNSA